jgi:2-polyprenyl-3-methyl-5-hydroxy-6-metoxy-1,4-benzoquinol methylase
MAKDVIDVFNADVEAHGGYGYANESRKSTAYVNRRFTDVIIAATHPDGKRVVDIGCGDGTYTAQLRAETKAEFILGIDPAAKAIEHANESYVPKYKGLAYRNCYASDLVAQGERFDVAIYRGVIHHASDPGKEIVAGLRLAERIFLLDPNGLNPIVKLLERTSKYHREHFERSYRMTKLRAWIEDAGGRIESAEYFGLVPMFSPDWMVTAGAALEPLVERLPGVRALACGQLTILASAGAAGSTMRGRHGGH